MCHVSGDMAPERHYAAFYNTNNKEFIINVSNPRSLYTVISQKPGL